MRCTWCEETYTRIPQTLKSKQYAWYDACMKTNQYAWYDACMSYTSLPKKILANQTMPIYKDYCGGIVRTLPIYTLAVYY